MALVVTIESGFASVGAGSWLMGRAQPAAFLGGAVRRRRKGWLLRDRALLCLVETSGEAKCADSGRPFLSHIPCAAPVSAVSSKVLVAPAAAWKGAFALKPIPMSLRASLCVSEFGAEWVVTATAGRTLRIAVKDGDTLTVRPEALVAWTGNRPTGHCPRIGLADIILPRTPRNLAFCFHGPCTVWAEGSREPQALPGLRSCRRAC